MQSLDYEPRRPPPAAGGVKPWAAALAAAVAFPAGGMLSVVYAAFVAARVRLGRFPSYNNPDPGSLPGAYVGYVGGDVLFWGGALLVPAAVWATAWLGFRRRPTLRAPAALAMTVGLWALLLSDPFGAFTWFVD